MAGTRSAQLEWEARWAKPAAICAFIFAPVGLVAGVIPRMVLGVPEDTGLAGFFIWISGNPSVLLAFAVLQAVISLFAIPALLYLYSAAKARDERLMAAARNLVVIGIVAMTAAGIVGRFEDVATATRFAASPQAALLSAPAVTAEQGDLESAISAAIAGTPAVQDAIVETADKAAATAQGPSRVDSIWDGILLAGTLAFSFGVLMISSAASRAGLVSRFLGYVGIAIGALSGLSALMALSGQPGALSAFLNPAVIEIFWIGALGLIFLNRWPNGRGPAWESGQAKPWPSAADQRAAYERNKASQIEATKKPPASTDASGESNGSAKPPGRKKKKRNR